MGKKKKCVELVGQKTSFVSRCPQCGTEKQLQYRKIGRRRKVFGVYKKDLPKG